MIYNKFNKLSFLFWTKVGLDSDAVSINAHAGSCPVIFKLGIL